MANPTLHASRMASAVFERHESWKIEHDKVKVCWMMEDHLKECNLIFTEYADLLSEYISEIRWTPDWGAKEEEEFHAALGSILKSFDSIAESVANVEQNSGYQIEGSETHRDNHEALRQLSDEIARILAAEARMGYGDIEIDTERATEFQKMLESHTEF
jgi:hypothetical protein